MEDKDSGKNKPANFFSADIASRKQSTYESQINKKDQNHKKRFWCRGKQKPGYSHESPIIGVNIVPEKNKKDISYIKCFYYKKKSHYSSKCL